MSETQDAEALARQAAKLLSAWTECKGGWRPPELQQERTAAQIASVFRPAIEARDKRIAGLDVMLKLCTDQKERWIQMCAERDLRIAELETENQCDACAGTGKPPSGRPCGCGGSGKMSDMARWLRMRATYLANRVREQHIQDHAAPLAEALRLIAGVEQGVGVHRPCCARGSSIARAALSSYDAYTQGQTAQRSE